MYEETMESMTSESAIPSAETETPVVQEDTANIEETSSSSEITETEPSCVPPEGQEKRQKWSAFVEGPAVDFFTGYKLEKMTIDDGSGNKAKFSRTKDDGIKVEYTSSVLL